jgi:ribosome-associated protein
MAETKFTLPQSELEFTYVRSSGAGGQNVNKVSSKAVLRWVPATSAVLTGGVRERFLARYGNKLTLMGDLIISSDRHRDQGRNTADCLEKLKEMIASVWYAPKKRKATKPTYGSKQRRLKSKKINSEKKSNRRLP